jgi:hypothetical protein
VEGSGHRHTGTFEGKMAETARSTTVSTKLERIAKLVREMSQVALTTFAHHIDIDWLREAYRRTRKDGATGVDRQTADEYARKLEEKLRSLLERARSGSSVAPPVRRVHIPKRVRARRGGPSAYLPSRTRCSNGRWSWCWKPFTSRVF